MCGSSPTAKKESNKVTKETQWLGDWGKFFILNHSSSIHSIPGVVEDDKE